MFPDSFPASDPVRSSGLVGESGKFSSDSRFHPCISLSSAVRLIEKMAALSNLLPTFPLEMKSFSLLQSLLRQSISREALEAASADVPSVALADCAGIQRNLFGIVVSGLPFDEATAFQSALKRHNFSTEVAEDSVIPVLHEAFTVQRVAISDGGLTFTDAMGRSQSRPLDELVFVAGGFLTRERLKSMIVLESGNPRTQRESQHKVRQETVHRLEPLLEFRLDFFFSSAQHRLRAVVSAENTLFFRERPLRLRDTALLLGAMMDLAELLPPDRVGEGLKQTDTGTYYPSLRGYEDEIRWHFHGFRTRNV